MMLDVMLNFKDFKILKLTHLKTQLKKSTQLIKTKITHDIIYIYITFIITLIYYYYFHKFTNAIAFTITIYIYYTYTTLVFNIYY
jgi:hypothetical protein